VTWDVSDAFQVSLRHRFIGSAKDGRIAAAKASGGAMPLLAVPETGQISYFDLSASYDIDKSFSIYGMIDNLGDHNPPFQLYERDTYDAIGRRFTIGFRKRF
jgi:outer membrane receptor for ferrienterochelin and colicin